MHALTNSLGNAEKDLLREAEPKRMAKLSEEELIELHQRIRRARNKYVSIYRRKGSANVKKKGGRGLAKQKNARRAGRVEVFEDALARVSTELADVAAARADQLKAERLAAANPPGDWPGAQQHGNDRPGTDQVTNRKPKGAGKTKRNASSRAQGARRQAKRDSR